LRDNFLPDAIARYDGNFPFFIHANEDSRILAGKMALIHWITSDHSLSALEPDGLRYNQIDTHEHRIAS
jgi:hypothetical protein